MPRMTGGQALVKSLYREGVRVVFGVPGVQLYHAMDALYDEPGIRFISNRHEQGSAYRQRCGKGEQVHSVLKSDLAAGRLPSGLFGANAAWPTATPGPAAASAQIILS